MKQVIKTFVSLLIFVGFSFICFHPSYTLEMITYKTIVLTVSCIFLVGIFAFSGKNTQEIPKIQELNEEEQTEISNVFVEVFTSTEKKAGFFSDLASEQHQTGNYKAAINYYIKAIHNGADQDIMDDNIWQAFKECYHQNGDEDYIKKYFDWMPYGAYHSEAKALLMGHYA